MKEIILKYARLGIYIEVLADCFKMKLDADAPNEEQVCWRPCINWFQDGEWCEDDCGCSSDLDLIMRAAAHNAEAIFTQVYNSQPLDFSTVPAFRLPKPE